MAVDSCAEIKSSLSVVQNPSSGRFWRKMPESRSVLSAIKALYSTKAITVSSQVVTMTDPFKSNL